MIYKVLLRCVQRLIVLFKFIYLNFIYLQNN